MRIAEADMGMTAMAYGVAEDNAMVQFFMQPRKNPAKSLEAGRDIFETVEYIKIMTPGNKDNIPVGPVTDIHRKRFAGQYKKWLETREEEQSVEGTPLAEWPGVSRSQVEELRFFNVITVEQLAELSDSNAQGFMGINMLRDRAKAFLEASSKQAAADENARLKKDNEDMKAQMAEMQAALNALTDKQPRRRKRTVADEAAEE